MYPVPGSHGDCSSASADDLRYVIVHKALTVWIMDCTGKMMKNSHSGGRDTDIAFPNPHRQFCHVSLLASRRMAIPAFGLSLSLCNLDLECPCSHPSREVHKLQNDTEAFGCSERLCLFPFRSSCYSFI